MILGRYKQNPGDVRRRQVDYGSFLETGETITSVTPSVLPATDTPFVVGNIVIDSGGRKFAYVAQGGEDGESYSATLEIVTSAGQRKNDTIEFDVEEDDNG